MKKIFNFLMIGALALGAASCKEDSPSSPNSEATTPGGGNENQGGSDSEMTVTESKLYLENAANEAINLFNPNDQRSLIELCAYVAERYEDYSFPDNFEIEDYYAYYNRIKEFFVGLAEGAKSGNGSMITRSSYYYIYNLDFDNFKGIYEANDRQREWVKKSSSQDIIFRFKDKDGQACELKATGSSASSSGNFDYSYNGSGFWFDGNNWHDGDWEKIYSVSFKLPTQINVTLTQNNTLMADIRLNSNINISGHSLDIDMLVNAANLQTSLKMNGNDSRITETVTTTVSGRPFVSYTNTINGSHLCDVAFISRYMGDDSDNEAALGLMLKSAESSVSLVNKVSINSSITYSESMLEAISEMWARDKRTADKYAQAINSNVTSSMKYNGNSNEQAKLKWEVEPDYYGGYDIVPYLYFPDDTSYMFGDYFDSGFTNVENMFNNILRRYMAVLNSVR